MNFDADSAEVGLTNSNSPSTDHATASDNESDGSDHIHDQNHAPPTEAEQISYLKKLLRHQIQLHDQEEEQVGANSPAVTLNVYSAADLIDYIAPVKM